MNLEFIEVKEDNIEIIDAIYDILKTSGEYLFNSKGLCHWRTPYPKESIKSNIKDRRVFIVKNLDKDEYIHTFQLDIIKAKKEGIAISEAIAEINKFATNPNLAGKGIGTKSIKFIEDYCMKNEISKILLEVYDKSVDAINFYKSRGFIVISNRETRYFNVLIMEKDLTLKKQIISLGNDHMKRLLIIGAGFLQAFVIKKAKELGYYTIAVDKNPDSLGFKYADEYEVVDIVDLESCLKYAKEKNIDGVMTAATDYGVLATSYIAQELELPGINYESAKLIKNKHSVRKLFVENNIDDVSQYYEVKCVEDIESIVNGIKYPVMVKPSDGSGSKAAKRVDKNDDLYQACKEAIDASLIKKALIEDFIVGKEYGVESFVCNGEIYVLGIMNKEMTTPPDYAELGHMMPSGLDNEDKIKDMVKNAIKVLGVDFGAVNMDVLVTNENHVCIIDVGARMGGNIIGSHIIPQFTGYDYLGNLIKATVGDDISIPNSTVLKSVVTKILALSPGKILKLPDFDGIMKNHNVEIFFNKDIGDSIREYRNNLDGCGYILSVGEYLSEVEHNAINAKEILNKGIIREQ